MKERIKIFFIILFPAITSIGLLIYLKNKGNAQMIEIDASAIIVACITAFVTLIGIIIVEIVGWRKTLDKLNRQDKSIGVNENRVCLSQQHDYISNSMTNYQNEIKAILQNEIIKGELNPTYSTIKDLHRMVAENDKQMKYRDMSVIAANEAELLNSHKFIDNLFEKYADALNEVKELQNINRHLTDKLSNLTLIEAQLKSENNNLKVELKKANQKIEHYANQKTQPYNNQEEDLEI